MLLEAFVCLEVEREKFFVFIYYRGICIFWKRERELLKGRMILQNGKQICLHLVLEHVSLLKTIICIFLICWNNDDFCILKIMQNYLQCFKLAIPARSYTILCSERGYFGVPETAVAQVIYKVSVSRGSHDG